MSNSMNKKFNMIIKNLKGSTVFQSDMNFGDKLEAQHWAIKQVEVGLGKSVGEMEIHVKELKDAPGIEQEVAPVSV